MPSGHRRSGPDRPPEQPTLLCAWTPAASARVVEASRWLASELDARIVLAHAFDAMSIQVPASRELAYAGVTSEDLSQLERARVAGDLEEAADALAGIAYTTVLADGPPVSVLQALAAEHQAYLLVTGTAAHGALDRILIGSVSSELAHSAGCPVVVVPDDAALAGTGPVVAAYDGSPDSLRAARHGAALAVRLGRELVLVHVAAPDADGARAEAPLSRELNDALAVIRPAPLNASIAIANGDPAERLSELAHERGAALLVLGTRGRGAVTSALLGSVSAAVVRRGGQPTVLVGPEAESWRA